MEIGEDLKKRILTLEEKLEDEEYYLNHFEHGRKLTLESYDRLKKEFGWREKYFKNWLGRANLIEKSKFIEKRMEYCNSNIEKFKFAVDSLNKKIYSLLRNYLLAYDPEFKKLVLDYTNVARIMEFSYIYI